MVNHGLFPDHCPCEESMTGDKLIPGRGGTCLQKQRKHVIWSKSREADIENFISREHFEMKCNNANHFNRCITTSKHS